MKPMLFGKYCLLERVSVGGMAEVFRAKPFNAPGFDGYLALKRILPHLAEDDEFIQMFIDEARLTVQLEHPNIVRIYELGQFQSSYYILMEYIAGRDVLTLQKRVRQRRETITPALSCYIAREMALGLDYAHRRTGPNGQPLNIIHRDISPQNVLVDYLGKVKVIDFGIAKAAVQSTKTQVGVLKGKMGYMSPEQVSGEQLDYRSDIFAIGTVLWEMLTNRRLFNGDNEFETMMMVKNAAVNPPSTKNPAVSPEIDRIVMRSLAGDRAARYQSGAELAHDLTMVLNHLGVGAEQMSLWMREVFAEELEEELTKRETFERIQTPEDVRKLLLDTTPPEPTAGESTTEPEEQYEKTEIWDAEILEVVPDENVDPMEFAAQHTVVQAGGFDPSLLAGAPGLQRQAPSEPPPPQIPSRGMVQTPPPQLLQPTAGAPSEFRSAGTRPDIKAPPQKTSPARYALMGISVMIFMALCVAFTYLYLQQSGANDEGGALLLTVTPASGIEVLIDGKAVATASPSRIENLPAGTHIVEVRHPDFEPFQKEVQIAGEAVEPLSIDLEPVGPPSGVVRIASPELAGLEIWIDGQKKTQDILARDIELEVGAHLVEMIAADHRPWKSFIDVKEGEKLELQPKLEPNSFTIEVDGAARSIVRFDDERVGVVPATIRKISPYEVHEIAVGRWESAAGVSELSQAKLVVDPKKPPFDFKKKDFGWLTVDTGEDWWAIWIDGRDTGLVSPITPARKLPVSIGKHDVSLRRGYEKHAIEIDVKRDETTILRKEIDFEWKE